MNKTLYFNTKKQNIFFTSDTHFWHKNIIKYCNRPFESVEEMNETIINNWNSVVGENDIVFHLGDVSFCGGEKLNDILNRLNGKIYLIIGNHDWNIIKDESKFEMICQQMAIKVNNTSIYLNHYPYLCFAGAWNFSNPTWQLFGHVHSSPLNTNGLDNKRLCNLLPSQYDVGVDNNNYTPVSYNKLNEIITAQVMSLNMHRGE